MSGYSWTTSFDNIDRVTSWNRSNSESQTWDLDKIGNWNSVTTSGQAGVSLENRTHNNVHELTTIIQNNMPAQTLAYDLNGRHQKITVKQIF